MSTRSEDDLALLLAPARAAVHDDAAIARSVRLARARTLSGAPLRRRSSTPVRTIGFVLAFAAFSLVSSLLVRTWLRERVGAPAAIAFSVGNATGLVGERIAGATRRVLDFTDGTRVELDPNGALRVIALDERGGRLLVEQGTIRASFEHHERTYWTVEAGGVVVEVTGTRFDVSFDQATQAFDLVMHEGSVRVRGCGIEEGRVVKGIEVIHASCATSPPAPAIPTLTPADLPSAPPSLAPAPAPAPTTTFVPSAPADGSMALLERADSERRSGDPSTASSTLLELRRRFPRGAGAPQAAFDLGVLAFDADRRYADAARWFRLYLDEAPRGPLAREALGRVMEAQSRSNDSEAAASSAARYLELYPGGPHASLAKRLVAQRP